MNIRRMLFVVIPLLFLLNNAVAYWIFDSGIKVQRSYNVMLDRVIFYERIAGQTQDNLRALSTYVLDRSDPSRRVYEEQRNELDLLRQRLTDSGATIRASDLEVRSYRNMIDTFIGQEERVAEALDRQDSLAYADYYEEAERTASYIMEAGYDLVDRELGYYQPFYGRILLEMDRLDDWGVAILILNTLISIVCAYWISTTITRPIKRLVSVARRISEGNLQASIPAIGDSNEFGLLARAFARMQIGLKQLIRQEKEGLEKDKLVKELELEVLQNQINPHFLFNSLNVLSKLALIEGAEQTSDLMVSMSNLLRYNLRNLDRPVTLGDEVEHAKEYFAIQQARYRNRIRFVANIEERALDVQVPVLTLQPILENIFVHGIEGMEEGAEITLDITRGLDEVTISISDNGVGMSEEVRHSLQHYGDEPPRSQPKGQSTGLGTRNVFKRLELFFGRRDLIDIRSERNRGTTVLIRIPTDNGEEEHGSDVSLIDRR